LPVGANPVHRSSFIVHHSSFIVLIRSLSVTDDPFNPRYLPAFDTAPASVPSGFFRNGSRFSPDFPAFSFI
jgi:hypothetical protein